MQSERDYTAREMYAAKFTLRMPNDLRDRLERAAREEGRSLNSEITRRLWKSFEGYRQL